jgi:Tfp pilus assembly protein PilV
MVIRRPSNNRERGIAMVEIVVAMALMGIALLPLSYSVRSDARLLRATCQHAVAMEIVDGEMEILAAGEWRYLPEGTHPYQVHAKAVSSLPTGVFELTRNGNHLRLQWSATTKSGVGVIVREATVK